MEGVMRRYLITLEVNGKISQNVYEGDNPIVYITGYLQAMLDHSGSIELQFDAAIKRLSN